MVLAFYLVAAAVLMADIVTKELVRIKMPMDSRIAVLPFFSLTHVDNTGIAFGLFQQRNLLFIGVGLFVTACLIGYGRQLMRTDRVSAMAMAVVVGGAVGNIVDRVLLGRVTDFLDFYAGPYHWPVFNVADSAICVGASVVAIRSLWPPHGSKRGA